MGPLLDTVHRTRVWVDALGCVAQLDNLDTTPQLRTGAESQAQFDTGRRYESEDCSGTAYAGCDLGLNCFTDAASMMRLRRPIAGRAVQARSELDGPTCVQTTSLRTLCEVVTLGPLPFELSPPIDVALLP